MGEKVRKPCFDTNVIAYYIEKNKVFGSAAKRLFKTLKARKQTGFVTFLSISELLVKPISDNNQPLVDYYNSIEINLPVKTLFVDQSSIELIARLKNKYSLKTPDAINLAIAISNNCDTFFTNDEALKKVSEIKILLLSELKKESRS
ncbi:MAG: Q3M7V5 PilT like protein [Microgenomates group bacterium GW2011_GWA1_48_10]|uniref:PIN domain-containing protein n=1 Tax=Candidatus Gottesmanbacteria bacterium RIFCSPHIGHO2_01_FULL_47_48 TaxID=1798381 RepID=A0A1F6A1B4_9BACT|nr:MAG: Q3M7V5 PilT like protein [Microgenomates group bacterium GW2011_GWA1_48_10]OGG18445.1 MAG: hypothetical protein A2721_01510 [Candidatus Gottesmanbacteria bacterium RIFCSPHIGHO2_01_FULL_47_48]